MATVLPDPTDHSPAVLESILVSSKVYANTIAHLVARRFLDPVSPRQRSDAISDIIAGVARYTEVAVIAHLRRACESADDRATLRRLLDNSLIERNK